MRILGIDPGTHRIGWGIVEKNNNHYHYLDGGTIELPPHTLATQYLPTLYLALKKLLATQKPDLVAIEKLFFQTNTKTAISVAQARGVILLSVAQSGCPYLEFSPNTIKSAIAGDGNANKAAVTKMVGVLLNLTTRTMLDDTCDALAVALTAGSYKL